MGHLAVITDRNGHFQTCHFKKSVKMACVKLFEYLFYSHIAVILMSINVKLISSVNQRVYSCGQILTASFFFPFYLIIFLIFVISQMLFLLSHILLLALFSVCVSCL